MNFALGLLAFLPDTIVVSPYLQNATPSSIVVAWETKGNSTECVVEYGTTENLGRSASGTSQITVEGHLVHHVTLNDLPPDSLVWYQVKTGDAMHGVHVFRTPALASDEGRQRFIAYSDMQLDNVNPRKHQEMVEQDIVPWSIRHAQSELDTALDFILIPGDLVSTGGNHTHW
ncbi:MAG: fibronectin type III domain-containing protein, partial [Planctomycetota bacterium]|nr:fibronectin type III domain-containing protein [Planctomycetota bacterium]